MGHILIIDDDPNVLSALQRGLQGAGHDVDIAPNGEEGLARLRDTTPDLVITDIFMPTMDGLEVIYALRQEAPDVKIIAISGGGYEGKLDLLYLAGRLGAKAVLRKPFELDDVILTVGGVLADIKPSEPPEDG